MSTIEIRQFICHGDNYGVLVHDRKSGDTISIDAPSAAPISAQLAAAGWKLTHILVTHHHFDHVEGLAELKAAHGCQVIGPDNSAIAGIDRKVRHGDVLKLANDKVNVIATPGHTLDMLNFHFTGAGLVFTGDTLFAMGCGRIFEGTAAQMWESLLRLAALPPETRVYCGHEYTLSNARFAVTVDPLNVALAQRLKEVEALRAENKPTLPTTIGRELQTNPFLRAGDASIRKTLGMEKRSDAEVFAEIRERKNRG
jgi:hydroxyacylglutathione hydrolase